MPRPRIGPRIDVRLTPEDAKWLQQLAYASNTTTAHIIRSIITDARHTDEETTP